MKGRCYPGVLSEQVADLSTVSVVQTQVFAYLVVSFRRVGGSAVRQYCCTWFK